jgi:hypothetical protein
MSDSCSRVISHGLSLTINGCLHVLILFLFLTVLYFLIIAPLEKDAFDNEIKTQVKNTLEPEFLKMKDNLSTNSPETLNIITNLVNYGYKENGETVLVIDKLIEQYDHDSDVVKEHNKWVKLTAISLIVFFTVGMLIVLFTLRKTCGKDIGIVTIVRENIITFIFVGIVEYLFFTQVAFKYVPAPPSTMVTTLIESFKETLNE